ncbi:MAG: hypothetical protein ACLR7D_13685 [Lachnospira eligens]
MYGGNLSVLGVLSEVCWVSDDSDVSLLILVVFTIESDDVFLCLAVIMPQITKMIITQYMNIMRICLLEKRDILIPRIMLSINISLYILKNYCFFHYLAEELLSVADVSLTRPSGWSETFNSLVLSS